MYMVIYKNRENREIPFGVFSTIEKGWKAFSDWRQTRGYPPELNYIDEYCNPDGNETDYHFIETEYNGVQYNTVLCFFEIEVNKINPETYAY